MVVVETKVNFKHGDNDLNLIKTTIVENISDFDYYLRFGTKGVIADNLENILDSSEDTVDLINKLGYSGLIRGANSVFYETEERAIFFLLSYIAPYVEDTSYIEMYDEINGTRWRYKFRKGEVKVQRPKTTWYDV